ncbi:hypothetical protein KSP40_PGU019720 [Platanthera guangdongensis]|uniref:Uncharacterized protein n=1 Tax=Platanthera guangdongensis TaxID=2320717 RepID=A0ABR2MQH9_9ASPA
MDLEVELQIIRDVGQITFTSTETDAAMITAAHLPEPNAGITRDGIEVAVHEGEGKISIRGGRVASREAVIAGRVAITRELQVEHFDEAFSVPDNADWDGVDAWFDEEEEVLVVLIPKLTTTEWFGIRGEGTTETATPGAAGKISEKLVLLEPREQVEEKNQGPRASVPEEHLKPEARDAEGWVDRVDEVIEEQEMPRKRKYETIKLKSSDEVAKELENREDEQKQVKALAGGLLRREGTEIELREPKEHEGHKLKNFAINDLETTGSWNCKPLSEELPHGNGELRLQRPDRGRNAEYQTKSEGMVEELQNQVQELQEHDKPVTGEIFEKSEAAGFDDTGEQKHRPRVVEEDEAHQSNSRDLKSRNHRKQETKKPTMKTSKEILEAEDSTKSEKEIEQEIMQPEEEDQKIPTGISHEKARIIKFKEMGEAERKDRTQKHEKPIVPLYDKPKDAKVPQKEEPKPQVHELQGDGDHRLNSFDTEAFKTEKSLRSMEESQGRLQGQEKLKQKAEKATVEGQRGNLEGAEPTKKEEKEGKEEKERPEKQDAYEDEVLRVKEPHQILEARQQIQSEDTKEKIQHEKEVEHEKLTMAPIYEKPIVVGSTENEELKPDFYVAMENEDGQRKSPSMETLPKITESMKSMEVSTDLQQKQVNEKQKPEKPSVGHPRDLLEAEEVADSEEEEEKQVQQQQEHPKEKDLLEHGKQTMRTPQEKDDNMLSKEQKELDGENKKLQVDELNRVFKAAEQIQLETEQVLEHEKSKKRPTEKAPKQMLEARSTKSQDSVKPRNTRVKEPQKELEAPTFIKWQEEKQLQEKREYRDHEEPFVEVTGKNNKTTEFWEPEDKHGEELELKSPHVEAGHINGSLKPTGQALYPLKPEEPKKENCKKLTTDGPDHMLDVAEPIEMVEPKDGEQGLQQSEEQNVENKKLTVGGKYLNLKPSDLSEIIKHHRDLVPSREDQDVDESSAKDITQQPVVCADLIKMAKETKQEELDQTKKFEAHKQNPNETQPCGKTNTMGLPNLEELGEELSQIQAEEMECSSRAVRKSCTKEPPQLKEPSHSPQQEEEQPKGNDSSVKFQKQHVEFQHPDQDKVEKPSLERELKLKKMLKEKEIPKDRHFQLDEEEEEASVPLQVNVVKEQETMAEPKQQEHQKENTGELQKPIAGPSHQAPNKTELPEKESKLKLHMEAAQKYEVHEPWHTEEQERKHVEPRQMASYPNEDDGLAQLNEVFVEQQNPNEEVERDSLGKELVESENAKAELQQVEHGSLSRAMKNIGLKKREIEAAIEQELIESPESNKNQESAVESPYQTRKIKDFVIVEEPEGQPKPQDQQEAKEKMKETKMSCTVSTHQEITLSGAEENAHEHGNRRESQKQAFTQQHERAEKIERPTIEIALLESEKLKKAPLQLAKQEESSVKKPTTLEEESKSLLEHTESREHHETTIKSPNGIPDMIEFTSAEEPGDMILRESEPKGIPKQQEQYQNKGSKEFENPAAGTLMEASKIEDVRSSEEQEHKFQVQKGQEDENTNHKAYHSKENEEQQKERTIVMPTHKEEMQNQIQLSADEHFKDDNIMKPPEKISKLIQLEKNVQKPPLDIEMKESVEPKQGSFGVVAPQGFSILKKTETEALSKSREPLHNHESKYTKTEEPSQAPQLILRDKNESQLQQQKMEATESKTPKPHKINETEKQKGEQLNSIPNNQEETTLLKFEVEKNRTPTEKMLETAGLLESKEPYKKLGGSLQAEAELQLKKPKEVEERERICLEMNSETHNRPSIEPSEVASETNVLEKVVREEDLYQHEEGEHTTEFSKSGKQLKKSKQQLELEGSDLQHLKEAAEEKLKIQIAERKLKQTDDDEALERKKSNRVVDNKEAQIREELYQSDKQKLEEVIELPKLHKPLDFPTHHKDRHATKLDDTIDVQLKPLSRISGVMEPEELMSLLLKKEEVPEHENPTLIQREQPIRAENASERSPPVLPQKKEAIEHKCSVLHQMKLLEPFNDVQKIEKQDTTQPEIWVFEGSKAIKEGKTKEVPQEALEKREKHTEEILQKTLDAPRPTNIREMELRVYIPKEIEEKQEHNSFKSFDNDLRNPEDIRLREVFSNEGVKAFGEEMNKCVRTKKPRRQNHFQCQCTSCRMAFPLPPSTIFAGSTFIFSFMVLVFHFIERKEPN